VSSARKRTAWLAALLIAPGLASAQLAVGTIRPLAFGKFAAGTGGTVSVDPSGARNRSGGVLLLPSSASPATFLLTDTSPDNANRAVIVTLPADGGVVLGSGADSMALTQFSSSPSLAGALAGGSLTLSVGATLNVGSNQPRGSYTGFIPVTVEYQ
jgi:hypothetical protein